MKNMECCIAILAGHRDARAWDDNKVAADLLSQLGLDPEGEATSVHQPEAQEPEPVIQIDAKTLLEKASQGDKIKSNVGVDMSDATAADQTSQQAIADATTRARAQGALPSAEADRLKNATAVANAPAPTSTKSADKSGDKSKS